MRAHQSYSKRAQSFIKMSDRKFGIFCIFSSNPMEPSNGTKSILQMEKKRNVTRKRAKGAENRERFRGRRRDRIYASFARRRALRERVAAPLD